MSGFAGEGGDSRRGPIAFATLAALALVWIHAAVELRPLFGDGFHYLLRILESEAYWLEAPARRTVELVRQLPVLAALKLGAGVEALGVVFGLAMLLLPLTLVALCWPALPRGRKHFFAFPLLHYCAGTLGSAFAPINEGATAAAWFWLLFFRLLFAPARGAALAFTGLLAAGTVLLHEGMVLLAPFLGAAALQRRRGEPAARFVFVAFAVWFAIVVVVEAVHLIDPARPDNRAAFFHAACLVLVALRPVGQRQSAGAVRPRGAGAARDRRRRPRAARTHRHASLRGRWAW